MTTETRKRRTYTEVFKADCWDNAPVERVFSRLRREWTGDRLYRARQGAIADVREYVACIATPSVCIQHWATRHHWSTRRTLIKCPETVDHYNPAHVGQKAAQAVTYVSDSSY
jgi:hypothetical protein